MTFLQYLGTFRLYSVDVLLLALGVTFFVSFLKKTVLKNLTARAYVVLPFALGILLYAIYRMILTSSTDPLGTDFGLTLEGGFATGCAATLYYVVYKQFFRAEKTSSPISPLLEGIVPEEKREEAAQNIYQGSLNLPEEALDAYLLEQLQKYADKSVTEEDLVCVKELVKGMLLFLRKR